MDMVLGAEWLMQLGTYSTNLKEQYMEFHLHGRHYKLYGNDSSNLKEEEAKQQRSREEAPGNMEQQSHLHPRSSKSLS